MLDLSYFQNQNSNVQGFFNGGTWQTWIKPRGAKLVNIICQGSGAGGGGGLGAGVSQAFDPKEDIAKEVARATAEGAIGNVLGEGAAKVLGGIYNKDNQIKKQKILKMSVPN